MENNSSLLILKKNLERKTFLRYFIKHNGPAVYVLMHKKANKAYLVSCLNLAASLARQISSLGAKAHPCFKQRNLLTLELLETHSSPELREIKKAEWAARLEASGIVLYNRERLGDYRVRVGFSSRGLPQVQVVSRGKRVWGGRECATMEEAKERAQGLSLEQAISEIRERVS